MAHAEAMAFVLSVMGMCRDVHGGELLRRL